MSKAETKKKIMRWADRHLPSDRSRRALIKGLSALHFLLMMCCFVLMWEMGYKQKLVGWYPYLGDLAIVAGYCVLFASLFKVYHALYVGRSRISELFVSQGLTYVSCSPFRVPVARVAASQAAIAHDLSHAHL